MDDHTKKLIIEKLTNNPNIRSVEIIKEFPDVSDKSLYRYINKIRKKYNLFRISGRKEKENMRELLRKLLLEDSSLSFNDISKIIPSCSRQIIGVIRRELSIGLPPSKSAKIKRTSSYTREEEIKIVEYIRGNRNTTNSQIMQHFPTISLKGLNILKRANDLLLTTKNQYNTQPLSLEDINDIINYIKERNPSYKEIMDKFPNTLKHQIVRLKYEYNLSRKIAKYDHEKILKDGERRCPSCKMVKKIAEFSPNYLNRCLVCEQSRAISRRTQKLIDMYSSLELLLKQRLDSIHKNIHYRKIPTTIEIDLEYLKTQYEKQRGKCFYSGKELKLSYKDPFTLSVDRIDSAKGYVLGNVVLCGHIVNLMKRNYTLSDFIEICDSVHHHMSTKLG